MLTFTHKCNFDKPCNKIKWDSIFSQDLQTKKVEETVYLHKNCIFCQPSVTESSIEDRERSKREDKVCIDKKNCLKYSGIDLLKKQDYCSECQKDFDAVL